MILVLFIGFIINVIILVYSDKLMNLFTNKYIRWYIAFNKKVIGIEICFLNQTLIAVITANITAKKRNINNQEYYSL